MCETRLWVLTVTPDRGYTDEAMTREPWSRASMISVRPIESPVFGRTCSTPRCNQASLSGLARAYTLAEEVTEAIGTYRCEYLVRVLKFNITYRTVEPVMLRVGLDIIMALRFTEVWKKAFVTPSVIANFMSPCIVISSLPSMPQSCVNVSIHSCFVSCEIKQNTADVEKVTCRLSSGLFPWVTCLSRHGGYSRSQTLK